MKKSRRLVDSRAALKVTDLRRRTVACENLLFSEQCCLQACYRAPKPQNPENTKNMMKLLNPPPRIGPENMKETNMTWSFLGHACIFSGFFLFRIFGGQSGVGDFVVFSYFSYFRDSGVFGLFSRPAKSQEQC